MKAYSGKTYEEDVASNSEICSIASNTRDYSTVFNSGKYSVAINTGDYGASIVEGHSSVAIATGVDGKAKGSIGCYLVLAEWDWLHRETVECRMVDGINIKPDTFYRLKNREFIEVESEEDEED